MFENLLLARDGAVAVLTVNRPQVLNALNLATLDELARAARLLRDDDSVRAVVITGAGQKAFAAGADLRELETDGGAAYSRRGQAAFDAIEQMGKPTIAAIHGFALGGGCELALACTLRVAAETAILGQPEVTLGLIPGFAATQRLPRLIGKGRAFDLLLTGRHVRADEALRMGLVNRVVAPPALASEADGLARTMAGLAHDAVSGILTAVHRGLEMTAADAQGLEASLFAAVGATPDAREGMRAFLEKRAPTFGAPRTAGTSQGLDG